MANTNISRVGDTHNKKGVCSMVFTVDESNYSDLNAAGNYLVGYLPNKAIITDAYLWTSVVSDAGDVDVGTTEAGTEILDGGDSTELGASGDFADKSGTGTGVGVYVSIAAPATLGSFSVIIEYIEFTKNTGELTKIV